MNQRQTRTYRFETLHHNRDSLLSLSPLKTILTRAQKDLPPCVISRPEEPGEELASKLIAKVRLQFKCSNPAHWVGPSLRRGSMEMAGPDV